MNRVHPDDWHAWRRGGIGGSDAWILLEGSALEQKRLWEVKTGRTVPPNLDDVSHIRRGREQEAEALMRFEEDTGLIVEGYQACMEHDEYPYIRCTFDGLVRHPERPGEYVPVEVKCPTGKNWLKYRILPPPQYVWQVRHQCLVAGADYGHLVFYHRQLGISRAVVTVDEVRIERMLSAYDKFWKAVMEDEWYQLPQDVDGLLLRLSDAMSRKDELDQELKTLRSELSSALSRHGLDSVCEHGLFISHGKRGITVRRTS